MSRTWKDRSYGANVRAARKHGWKLDPDAKALIDEKPVDIEGYAASMRSVNSKLARSIEASCSPDRDHDCGWCHENRVHRDRKRGYVDDADLEDIPVDHIPGDLKNDEYRRPVN